MSKTVDELMVIYDAAHEKALGEAQVNENFIEVMRRAQRAGIRAVIAALRDEFGRIMYPGDDWNRQGILEQFDQILAPREGGQAAGGSTSNASKAIGEGGASVPGTPTPAAPAPTVGQRLIKAAHEAAAIARGDMQPGRVHAAPAPDVICPHCNGEGCTPHMSRRGNVYPEPCQHCDTTGRVAAPAPDVCVWVPDVQFRDAFSTGCGYVARKRPAGSPCICAKPISFKTEAQR